MTDQLSHSCLPRSIKPSNAAVIGALFSDSKVRQAAAACRAKTVALAEDDSALFAETIRAINGLVEAGRPLTADDVAGALRAREAEIAKAFAAGRAAYAAHDAERQAWYARLAPLAQAVADLSTRCATERIALLQRKDGARRAASHGHRDTATQRLALMEQAGLTRDQIVALGLPTDNEAEARDARLHEIDVVLSRCAAFSADPLRDPGHLHGLGLDALIGNTAADLP